MSGVVFARRWRTPLHALDATRVHQTRSWVVSVWISGPFGPRRDRDRRSSRDSVRTGSNLDQRPPIAFSDGDESRRRRKTFVESRDAASDVVVHPALLGLGVRAPLQHHDPSFFLDVRPTQRYQGRRLEELSHFRIGHLLVEARLRGIASSSTSTSTLIQQTFFSSFLSFFRSFSSFFARSKAACDSAFVMESICFFNNLRSLNL